MTQTAQHPEGIYDRLNNYGMAPLLDEHVATLAQRNWDRFAGNLDALTRFRIPSQGYLGALLDFGLSISLIDKAESNRQNGRFNGFNALPVLRYTANDSTLGFLHHILGVGNIQEREEGRSNTLKISAIGDVVEVLEEYSRHFQRRAVHAQAILSFFNNEDNKNNEEARRSTIELVQSANQDLFTTQYSFSPMSMAAFFDGLEAGLSLHVNYDDRDSGIYQILQFEHSTRHPGIAGGLGKFLYKPIIAVFPERNGTKSYHVKVNGFAIFPLLEQIRPYSVFRRPEIELARDYLLTAAVFATYRDFSDAYKSISGLSEKSEIMQRREVVRAIYNDLFKQRLRRARNAS